MFRCRSGLARGLLLAPTILAGGCGCDSDVTALAREFAGPMARACGVIAAGADRAAAVACALESDRAGQTFWIRYDFAGRDAMTEYAFARASDGRLTYFSRYTTSSGVDTFQGQCSGPLVQAEASDGMPGLSCASDRVPAKLCD